MSIFFEKAFVRRVKRRLEPFRESYARLAKLKVRFHISAPAYEALDGVIVAFRDAARLLTNDPYYFGGTPYGQAIYEPPAAPPIPGIIRVPLAQPSKIKHQT